MTKAWREASDESFRRELPGIGETEEGVFDPPYDFLRWTLRVEENAIVPQQIKDVYLTISWDTQTEDRPGRSDGQGPGGKELVVCMYVAAL